MKHWKFNLEAVRQHRHTREEQAAQQVGAALRKLAEASERVRSLRAELLGCCSTFFPHGTTSPDVLLRISDYITALQEKVNEAVSREQAAQNNLEQARKEWRQCATDREAIDQLFARKKAEYQAAVFQEEQKILDAFTKNHAQLIEL